MMKIEVVETITDTKFLKKRIKPDLEFGDNAFFGFDPGTRNLGIAFIYPTDKIMEAVLYKVNLERVDDAVERMINVRKVLSTLNLFFKPDSHAVIEGASFGNVYRQVELAEQRASIALWCVNRMMNVKIVPPKTIRKGAFGDGNIKNPWEDQIEDNMAAALGCAIYGYKNL
jgi:Holliday junction resolvasome RuvABC endonuclease subunit